MTITYINRSTQNQPEELLIINIIDEDLLLITVTRYRLQRESERQTSTIVLDTIEEYCGK